MWFKKKQISPMEVRQTRNFLTLSGLGYAVTNMVEGKARGQYTLTDFDIQVVHAAYKRMWREVKLDLGPHSLVAIDIDHLVIAAMYQLEKMEAQ